MGALDLDAKFVEQDGKLFIGASQDCVPIAEFAKAQQSAGYHGSSEMRHAAKIPNVIIEAYCNDNKVSFADVMNNPEHIRRICNDPKNAAFRIWPGRL
ncbi:MAG TPA: hypothetical protein VIF60_24375 [Burkholderiaceae bacterium]|jgi:hypothetical protein